MAETLIQELLDKDLATKEVSLRIGYSGYEHAATNGSHRLDTYTNIPSHLQKAFLELFEAKANKSMRIRTLNLSLNQVKPMEETGYQPSLFSEPVSEQKEVAIERAMIEIHKKYGKNAMLRGIDYMPKATLRVRNTLIGGHHA